ncbi:phosphoribosylamine--glycine ligase [Agaricicola taiwanensis]|uniref:Phosphoribosylamine--glycine ligase n=1 Tax=Agaricicola taiwanensis TaxID=591372 RepID=A0A8J2VKI2_9RHOB|nr:phosphoribosylamine--glycine ligase [Agaricicola taiwanensis]GGE34242.1 phosphoribosylamine--glycine ligase [Agaricicola taiwanensis]
MNILLIGSGGREHALAWKLAQSPELTRLYAAPGNPGIADHADIVALDVADHGAVTDFCRDREIGLVVVGPEVPLVAGLVDDLGIAGIRVFGPTKAAAQLEGSKVFTKELCAEYGIPTARHQSFNSAGSAKAYIRAEGAPIVVKADGLAAGKGVTVAASIEEAEAAVDALFAEAGDAEATVVIEECMVGEEASLFCLVDGETVISLGGAQDHKRVFDGDEGPNTGGMGAYSPAPVLTPELEARAIDEIVKPTARAMSKLGIPFRGVLYAGLMLTREGPKLIEYNVRFGDPECQVLMPRLASDLLPLLVATADGRLDGVTAEWRDVAAITVVMAARGYPGTAPKGSEIRGVDTVTRDGVKIFHAGTKREGDRLLAWGGRVLNVTATAPTLREARDAAYAAVDTIDWPEGFCRKDIGWRALG